MNDEIILKIMQDIIESSEDKEDALRKLGEMEKDISYTDEMDSTRMQKNIPLIKSDQYEIQPIASPQDERHIDIMVANYMRRFKALDEAVIRHTLIEDIKSGDQYYAFVELKSGKCVGFGSLKGSEVGYEIVHDRQNQGVDSACILMFIDYLREWYSNLIAKVYSDNFASIRILEKAGAMQIDSEESDYAKFIKSAADLFNPEIYEEALKIADAHYIVTYRI